MPGVNEAYCTACGHPSNVDARFCSACGAGLDERASIRTKVFSKVTIIILTIVIACSIVGAGLFAVHEVKVSKENQAAIAAARIRYRQLSQDLDRLLSVEANLKSAHSSVDSATQTLEADTRNASQLSQERHDEGESNNRDVVKMHDLAQSEDQLVTDAETQQSLIESQDTLILSDWTKLYGESALRQFSSDVAARNEARDNSLTEWSRAVGLINDNIDDNMRLRGAEYNDSDIVNYYTESDRDSNDANRYAKLVQTDGEDLQKRMNDDELRLRSQTADLKREFPQLSAPSASET